MRAHDSYPEVNVEAAQRHLNSIYHFWQNTIKVRNQHWDVFVEGGYEMDELDSMESFTFVKMVDEEPQLRIKEQKCRIPQSLKNKRLNLHIMRGGGKSRPLSAWGEALCTEDSK